MKYTSVPISAELSLSCAMCDMTLYTSKAWKAICLLITQRIR